MEDGHTNQPQRWERAGLVIGLVIALAIMWGVLAFALIAGDGQSDAPQVIYDQSDANKNLDEDE